MHTEPRVCVVLINYNGVSDTIECMESINGCSYSNFTIVVVDNKSTDDSLKKLKEYKKRNDFILIEAPENKGFSAGNNLGIQYALRENYDYVLLLNNDTVVTYGFLSELMKKASDSTVVTGTILYYSDKTKIWYAGGGFNKYLGKAVHYHQNETFDKAKMESCDISFITGCEMLLPVEAIKNVGFLDEDYFLYSEDVDYSLRLEKHGFKMVYVPKSIIYHKVGASTSKISKKSQYYSARNRRILIYRNLKWHQRISALVFTHAQTIRRIIDGRQSVKCTIWGIYDYYCNNLGKTDRRFD